MQNLIIGIQKRKNRITLFSLLFLLIIISLSFLILLIGDESYSFSTLIKVLNSETVPGASFSIMEIRLPKLLAGIIAGWSFGLAGFIFQTMLRNSLASPDIIGVTSSSSIAAVFCILVLKTNSFTTGIISIAFGLATSLILFLLAKKDGFSVSRLIILGIGFQAVTRAGTSFLLLKAARYELQEVMRWLSGSLSFTKLDDIPLVLIVSIIATIIVLFFNKRLEIIELGEEIAMGLGANPDLSRLILILCAVSLTAFSTAITGPIACISFLAGPIALNIGNKRSPILAGLVGILLVLSSEIFSQNILPARYPVGVVTGLLGSPYLIYLLIKMNRRNI